MLPAILIVILLLIAAHFVLNVSFTVIVTVLGGLAGLACLAGLVGQSIGTSLISQLPF